MTAETPFTQRLAEFAANTPSDAMDADAMQVLRLSLLDWLSVGLAGIHEPVSRICRDMVLDEGGAAQASVFGSTVKLPARAAALSNGTTSHALDYDDTHFAHIGHPSVAIFSAALAVAERENANTMAFLEAALIGMEVSIRVGVWLGRSHYQTGFHQTATAGAFGAAAACARLMGFDADQTAATLGLTATRASGLKAQFGTMGKPFNAGLAAANGVEAATLVARGFVPNPLALEGALGFGAIHAGEGDGGAALAGLGQDWMFTDVRHKFHACCHGLHATLEALALMPEIDAGEVERIDILTHDRWMTVCNQPAPTTGLGAKFSYTTVAAMTLLGHSTAALNSYDDALCAQPELVALRDRVTVAVDPALEETQARVTISLRSGGTHDRSFDLNAPMSLGDRETRVRAKAAALLGQDRADALWRLCLDRSDDLTVYTVLPG
ncbi:MmgE/PrpD family protein [Marivita sp. S6314]|uniref:MmgE/PrpD family protein n=1 Tax=Marivita sp. S6314 TaxID=2926406 RepID=UPI001FF56581|nr:MmgE/PrpD family protein [Marivita sp. S6314]MCK0148615.1 MmgE/PrpD family protein [Marivita sp. S6314]